MQLTDVIQPDCIKVPLEGKDKEAVISELVDLMAEQGRISDPEELKEAARERESTRTTGIGHGIAIPHGKTSGCDRVVLAVGKAEQPIDFQAIDGQPVRIVFLLASPPDQTGPHIQTLAQISRLMSSAEFRSALLDADDPQTIHDLIAEHEKVAVE